MTRPTPVFSFRVQLGSKTPQLPNPFRLTVSENQASVGEEKAKLTVASLPTFRAQLPTNFVRGLAGFHTRTAPELLPCGVAELDVALGGGFPRSSLLEICGAVSSGRTSLGLALLAQATKRGESCAFIDVSDSLDPVSLSAAGVDLTRLLWIRCGEEVSDNPLQLPPSSNIVPSCNPAKKASEVSRQASGMQARGFSWQHPRKQMRGMEVSIPQLLRRKSSNKRENSSEMRTTTHQTRLAVVTKWNEEQVETDRQLPRRGENIRRHRLPPHPQDCAQPPLLTRRQPRKPWKRLEQALKAADLLLHGGGWGVVVFDLGSISWVHARRIPLSTWFRFQRTIENTPAILLLLAEESCAKSCASVVLQCRRLREKWDFAAHNVRSSPATLQSFEIQGEIVRSRTHFQACNFASWETHTIWKDNF